MVGDLVLESIRSHVRLRQGKFLGNPYKNPERKWWWPGVRVTSIGERLRDSGKC